ncbi:lymphocyte-specific helicase-like [Gigantopelta aegis]|uniref:lymphocyte-specific helicase-like n=1 Tax=Gigantopelta aegis TaxID=1735272 RepID=UPI001B8894DD|nr:lymphocyte-specific helicase-like [Gigantopelta aegis]XP_041371851.1 lymphocyte-specific helicase-like [Gigantopelta aegis]
MSKTTLCTDGRSVSPVKPEDSAVKPKEMAHEVRSVSPFSALSDEDEISPPSLLESKCLEYDESSNASDSLSNSLAITDMMEEEKKLEQENLKKEQKLKEDQEKLWLQMSEEDREQRYKRLQFLLSKSNMYTQYLIQRMEKQQEVMEKKRNMQLKRRANKEKKEKELESSQSSQSSVASETRSSRKRKTPEVTEEAKPKPSTKKPKITETAKNENLPSPVKEENVSIETANTTTNATEEKEVNNNEIDHEDAEDAPVRIIDGQEVHEEQPLLFTGGVLRQYQIDGYIWLRTLYENGVNGILADEMGLGKTVQCVAMLAHLTRMGVSGPFLVCAPLSTLPNWYSEFKRFAPKVPVLMYHGSKDKRELLRSKIHREHKVEGSVSVQPVVITSYEIAMMDKRFLQNNEWKYLIVDEGHRIKNSQCRLVKDLRMYKTTHRLLLTGTPLQNNLAELWSLLNFLLPEIFDDLGSFEAWFDIEHINDDEANEKLIAEEQKNNILSMLHQILTPFMLRRLKADVELVIPPKKELMVLAPLTRLQKEFYSATVDRTIFQKIREKNEGKPKVELDEKGRPLRKAAKKKVDYKLMMEKESDLTPSKNKKKDEEELDQWINDIIDLHSSKKSDGKSVPKKSQVNIKMQNTMMQLRKCCNHPYLLEHPIDAVTGDLVLDESIIQSSGKFLLLDRMLPKLKEQGHKVLIFSQMTKLLDLLEDMCVLRDHKYCRLDGSCSVETRSEQMQLFNNDPDIFLFLVSTRAGGLGINLTAADTVIIFDSDWNPQSDLQAQDRCHRIGQTKPVVVYRFVTSNTIDQRIVERAASKRKLEKMIIHRSKFKSGIKNFNTSLQPISVKELNDLLYSKDHEGVIGKDDTVISDAELKSLLDRSDLEQLQLLREKDHKLKRNKKKAIPQQKGKCFQVIDTDVNEDPS